MRKRKAISAAVSIDLIIDRAEDKLSEPLIKEIHRILKTGTSDSCKSWFNVGDYKKLPNEVGGNATCPPEEVHARMKALLSAYNAKPVKTLEDMRPQRVGTYE